MEGNFRPKTIQIRVVLIHQRESLTTMRSYKMTESSNESFSFVDSENQILSFWQKNQVFQRSLEQTEKNAPYIFYDGPPFATGLPHHGHLVASTIKDIIPRYFTMNGRYVSRRFGWDCHGLPVEHEIDKKLGMSAQDAVAKIGVKKYNDECRGIVQRYVNEWEKTITRIGRWVDFEHDYKTMDLSFMESVWWVFKQVWDKGLIYQGTKVVPFSTALGTVLSNFEASSNYQDVQDPAVTVLFSLEDEDCYLSAWTTTPWTLPSNLALCVNADIDYVKVKDLDKSITLIMAKDRLEAYSKKRQLEVVEEFKGSQLKGKRYQPLFPYFSELKKEGAFQVLTDDYVTTTDGTGIVHIAPAFGEDDNRVMKEAGIKAIVCPVDDSGKFSAEVRDYEGLHVKTADKSIIKTLKEEHKLYHQDVLVHSYPFCPRSDTPLIYKAIPSWYLNVDEIKQKLLKANEQINWVPEHIKEGRFGKWLEGARDWAISRNRVWGTPLPIWINDVSGKTLCFGSVEELEKATDKKITDLHREHVDSLDFEITGEEGVYKRVPEVLDCWFESGSMPYAQLHYPFENQETFKQGFPAEFIAEGLDQTRGWFYTLTVLSVALYDKPAFKNVVVNGLVQAHDGKKMSKRLKNYTPPDEIMEKHGADALRLFLINSGLVRGEELRFSDDGVKDMVRRALLPWYNSFKFFQTYAKVDQWDPKQHFEKGDNILDRWILSKLQTLTDTVNKEMQAYHLYNVVPALFHFIEDLTNWYIRLNRRRFWGEGLEADKKAAYSTLYTTLFELNKLMAPFAPFLSEHIYQEIKASDDPLSVHLCTYPQADNASMDPILEDAVGRLQQIVLLGRQKRNQKQIKVKTPLKKLTVLHSDDSILKELSKLEPYIKTELNVKQVDYSTEESEYINLYAKPNAPVLGKRLGKRFGAFRKSITSLNAEKLLKVESGESIEIDGESFGPEDFLIFREAKNNSEALSNRLISINLECELTDELIQEGHAREVVNRIQKARKELDFKVDDRIQIKLSGDPELVSLFQKHQDYIQSETLCDKVELEKEDQKEGISCEVEGMKFTLDIKVL
jgi:isoleucyl-tRNA synthetase